MTPILGIDPGLSGALALYSPTSAQTLKIYPMPTHTKTTDQKTKKKILDCRAIVNWVDLHVPQDTHVYLEAPTARPGQGVTSMFSFGKVCGMLEMAIVAAGLRLTLVSPVQWKRAMGLSADKDQARRRASQLFPLYVDQWSKTSEDGKAEAALLAYYGSTKGGAR